MVSWDARTKDERFKLRAEMVKEAKRILSEADPSLLEDELQRKASSMVNGAIARERQIHKQRAACQN